VSQLADTQHVLRSGAGSTACVCHVFQVCSGLLGVSVCCSVCGAGTARRERTGEAGVYGGLAQLEGSGLERPECVGLAQLEGSGLERPVCMGGWHS